MNQDSRRFGKQNTVTDATTAATTRLISDTSSGLPVSNTSSAFKRAWTMVPAAATIRAEAASFDFDLGYKLDARGTPSHFKVQHLQF